VTIRELVLIRCVRYTGGGAGVNNRYHDPTLGTFISVDPLVGTTGEPFIYASGNPTTVSDPGSTLIRTPEMRVREGDTLA
jgi:hypothetical protein